jgi:AsmA protein
MTNRNQPPRFQDHRPGREPGPSRHPQNASGRSRRPAQRRPSVERSSGGFGSFFVFLLVGIAAIIAAGLAFIIVAPPTDLIRSQIVAQVEKNTGRQLIIAGPANFTIFPALGVSLQDVTLGAPPQMAGAPLATMNRLDVRLQLMPLLTGRIAIDTLVLSNPVIDLRVDKSGVKSWEFAQHPAQSLVRLAQAATGSATDAPSLVPDSARRVSR